jgi:hypothetical protein
MYVRLYFPVGDGLRIPHFHGLSFSCIAFPFSALSVLRIESAYGERASAVCATVAVHMRFPLLRRSSCLVLENASRSSRNTNVQAFLFAGTLSMNI